MIQVCTRKRNPLSNTLSEFEPKRWALVKFEQDGKTFAFLELLSEPKIINLTQINFLIDPTLHIDVKYRTKSNGFIKCVNMLKIANSMSNQIKTN